MSAQRPVRGRLAAALRIAGVNAVLILAGLALIALAGEAWLRLTAPFIEPASPVRFVPGVGVLYEPHAEVRHTNGLDFWTTQRANSLGFLDREPPDPARAAASCHAAIIGDSYVAARQVEIADKLQVRLEALAAREAPQLGVTASAYGFPGTAQAGQLPYYDEYARPLRPNLVVLVVVRNDFDGASSALQALWWGWNPDRTPHAFPERGADGAVRLRPPDPGYAEDALPWFRGIEPSGGWRAGAVRALTGRSLLARWLDAKRRALTSEEPALPPLAVRAEQLAARPGYGWILDGWRPADAEQGRWHYTLAGFGPLLSEEPPPVFAEALDFTAWSLAEFKRRADRDGAALAVLSSYSMGGPDSRWNAALRGMADPLGIPVIDQREWIADRGRVEDARWPHDAHWSPQGHQWAAEAILDWLRRHPEVCEDAA